MTDEDRLRRRSAKLVNEPLKLLANFCNTLGVASFVTLLLAPLASGRIVPERGVIGIVLSMVLHGAGQLLLLLWQSED